MVKDWFSLTSLGFLASGAEAKSALQKEFLIFNLQFLIKEIAWIVEKSPCKGIAPLLWTCLAQLIYYAQLHDTSSFRNGK
jgi:hypothetical protein